MTYPLTVQLMGGVGNQLFQLGLGLEVSRIQDRAVRFSFNDFQFNYKRITRRRLAIKGLLKDSEIRDMGALGLATYGLCGLVSSEYIVREKRSGGDLVSSISPRTRFVIGYSQNYSLMCSVWPLMFNRIRNAPDEWREILQPAKDYCALHVRLGDFVSHERARRFHGLSHPSYFEDALDAVSKRYSFSKVKVVSDDLHAAKSILQECGLDRKFNLEFCRSGSSLKDLVTIAHARAIVASNSTFSWWGGFIAERMNDAVVAVPLPWFASRELPTASLIPDHWIGVSRRLA